MSITIDDSSVTITENFYVGKCETINVVTTKRKMIIQVEFTYTYLRKRFKKHIKIVKLDTKILLL